MEGAKKSIIVILLCFFLLPFSFNLSLNLKFVRSVAQPIEDVPYLIVDRTKTPWGHKFFKTFVEFWKAPQGITGYTIKIKEEKVSFKQSWIVVEVGDNIYYRRVFVKLLKPTTSDMDMQRYALMAAKRVLKYLLSDYLRFKTYETF